MENGNGKDMEESKKGCSNLLSFHSTSAITYYFYFILIIIYYLLGLNSANISLETSIFLIFSLTYFIWIGWTKQTNKSVKKEMKTSGWLLMTKRMAAPNLFKEDFSQ